ncbi:hypothetical protein ACFU8F_21785, partial [Streptomyces griseus]
RCAGPSPLHPSEWHGPEARSRTAPPGDDDRHEVCAPGRQAPLPASIGADVSPDVDEIVRAGRSKR